MIISSFKQIEEFTDTVLTETCCSVLLLVCSCLRPSCECRFVSQQYHFVPRSVLIRWVRKLIKFNNFKSQASQMDGYTKHVFFQLQNG